ncbi:restriction endonuclease subunit S [Schaalia sp. lx-100]|uniref:restriction endonuclease subunit S n=1 Tax=Schaalia sp. lx-100 TaxID=2899081 RepID=UPI001E2EE5F0|nr:restriction endonuclease subunit S [Schaalia sp. lx-100]MCD4557754.1 restriction endonuclease subunit S [Schaalia sp. lx-100]
MSVVFQEGVLSDIARVTMGQSPKKEFVSTTEEGLPLLNGPTEFGNYHPTPVQWSTSFSKTAEPGDILFCVRGSTTGRMNWADQQYAIGRGIASISAINPQERHFVRGAIDLLLPELLAAATGSTFPNVSRLQLSELPVALPSAAVRTEISGLLGALNDKIESNRNLTAIISNLIDALIKCELSKGSGDSFPVSKLAKFVNGGAYTKGASGTGRMVIRIADLNSGPGASTIYNDIDVPGDRLAHLGDLLMSWSGSLGVYVWVREEAIVNQHIFKVVLTDFPAWLVHNRLNEALNDFRSIAADKATTMGHIQRKHLNETFVEVPVMRLERLDHLCEPLWHRFISAQLESLRLAALRDSLLPELMSGRMRVDEAGQLVNKALDEEVVDV